jgi:hypothetical protein
MTENYPTFGFWSIFGFVAVQDPENRLASIDWQTRKMFASMAQQLERYGLDIRVRSGLRSCSEQNSIYAQGRTTSGPIVTEAPGCSSWHVMGRAIDADPIDRRTGQMASVASGAYTVAGSLWEKFGGVWGGHFSFQDFGHFEWHPGIAIHTVCPNSALCDQSVMQIATIEPPLSGKPWLFALSGFAVVGALLWIRRS